jgi:hypothetical protein
MIYRDHFFDTMDRVRTAKEEKNYFPKASNQPGVLEPVTSDSNVRKRVKNMCSMVN